MKTQYVKHMRCASTVYKRSLQYVMSILIKKKDDRTQPKFTPQESEKKKKKKHNVSRKDIIKIRTEIINRNQRNTRKISKING